MRLLTLSFILSISFFNSFAQNSYLSNNDKIVLATVIPASADNLTAEQEELLTTKIIQIAAHRGVSATAKSGDFTIYPQLTVFQNGKIRGLSDITVVKIDFSLFIGQASTAIVFSSVQQNLTGQGSSTKQAITDAIRSITPKDKRFDEFIASGKAKIFELYDLKCEDYLAKSRSLTNRGEYARAMTTLTNIPEEINDCHTDAQNLLIKNYLFYQDKECRELLTKAQAEAAKGTYEKSMDIISYIDPQSQCYPEALMLINKVETKVEEKELIKVAERMKANENNHKLYELRIQAITEIATALSNQPADTYISMYNLIFR